MKITILGTRGEIKVSAPYHRKHSGVLIDDTLLFDLGEKEFLTYNPNYIFITHLHPDHAYFVHHQEKLPPFLGKLYLPEACHYTLYGDVSLFSDTFKWQGYTITAIPTEHSLKVKSQAYLIEKNGVRVLYTGDLFWIEKQYHHLLSKLDLVITDGSYLKEGGMIRCHKEKTNDSVVVSKPFGHTGIPNLIKLFAPHAKHILFVHFGSWFYKMGAEKARDVIVKYGKEESVKAQAAYDGMVLTVGKGGIQ